MVTTAGAVWMTAGTISVAGLGVIVTTPTTDTIATTVVATTVTATATVATTATGTTVTRTTTTATAAERAEVMKDDDISSVRAQSYRMDMFVLVKNCHAANCEPLSSETEH